ncbi:MAG TPA: hypothetical protein PKB10_00625, partial [Tepidisphaeraceae bacterium]|nr:hypothetical protein [Tepidisphaeraceae bacterium]
MSDREKYTGVVVPMISPFLPDGTIDAPAISFRSSSVSCRASSRETCSARPWLVVNRIAVAIASC